MSAPKFAQVRRGYDCAAVDAYIGQQQTARVAEAAAFKDKIGVLEEDKRRLRTALEEYRAKQQAIADALTTAQQVLQQAKQQAETYARLEQERLNAFCAQWTA